MSGKFDWDRVQQSTRMATNGCEPIAKDYAEFGWSKQERARSKAQSDKLGSDNRFLCTGGRIGALHHWLRHIEQALRSGKQPVVPHQVASAFAREIDALRMKPEVRVAYWNAVKRSTRILPR